MLFEFMHSSSTILWYHGKGNYATEIKVSTSCGILHTSLSIVIRGQLLRGFLRQETIILVCFLVEPQCLSHSLGLWGLLTQEVVQFKLNLTLYVELPAEASAIFS